LPFFGASGNHVQNSNRFFKFGITKVKSQISRPSVFRVFQKAQPFFDRQDGVICSDMLGQVVREPREIWRVTIGSRALIA